MKKRRRLALVLALALSLGQLAPASLAAPEDPAAKMETRLEEEMPETQAQEDLDRAGEEAGADPVASPVRRLAGSDRIKTAIEVSKQAFGQEAPALVLAGSGASADALAGTLFASQKKAPLLLVGPHGLTPEVQAEIKRLAPKRAYLLGGTGSLAPSVDQALQAQGIGVERVQGKNRYATAVEIAKTLDKKDQVFLALGQAGVDSQGRAQSLADALAIGPASAKEGIPVLLTAKDHLPQETSAALKSFGVKKLTLVGGQGSISKQVEKDLIDLGIEAKNIDRLAGKNRYETAQAIAKRYFKDSKKALLANGTLDVDALVGGVLAALEDAPILLSPAEVLPAATQTYVRDQLASLTLLGGHASISQQVEEEILALLTSSVEVASRALDQAAKSKDPADLAQAAKLISALKEGDKKTSLVQGLEEIKEEMKKELVEKAQAALAQAEESTKPEDLEAARRALEVLEEGDLKKDLAQRLDQRIQELALARTVTQMQEALALKVQTIQEANQVLQAYEAFYKLSAQEINQSKISTIQVQAKAQEANDFKNQAIDDLKTLLVQGQKPQSLAQAQQVLEAKKVFDALSDQEKVDHTIDVTIFQALLAQARAYLRDHGQPQG